MTFLDYLMLVKRHWKAILLVSILTAVLSCGFAFVKNKNPYKATIFLSIGVNETEGKTAFKGSIYENVQAADQFAETVQGWFKNPDFLARIELKTGVKANISAHKQEKQNLVVTYASQSKEQAQAISMAVQTELVNELNVYNQQTNTTFRLAIFGLNIEEAPLNLLLFGFLGIFGGFILGLAIAYSYEQIKLVLQ